jgi:CHAD domain-containing protein
VNHLIELRRQQEKKLRKLVDKNSVREIRKRLKRAGKNFSPKVSRDPLMVAKGMLQRLDRTDAPLTEPVLHQYRILSKRARYAAEFAGESADAVQFIASLRRVQDALGDWHDWLTLTQTALDHLGEVHESSLVAELRNVTGAKFRHAVAVLSHLRANLPAASGHAVQPPAKSTGKATHPAASAA